MSKHKNKPKKINKPVEEAVNPIVFNCNALSDKFLEDCYSSAVAKIGDSTDGMRGWWDDNMVRPIRDTKSATRLRRLKVLPFTVHAYEERLGVKVDMNPPVKGYQRYVSNGGINEFLCNAYIKPSPTCKVRKVSERAMKFLLSLGAPADELRKEYREYLYNTAAQQNTEFVSDCINGKFYEELLELPINGHTDYIYLVASTEMCHILHRRDPKVGENEYFNIPLHPSVRDSALRGATFEYDEQYDNWSTGNVFDVEALLTNLWIAESLRTCEICSEPDYSRHASDRPVILAGKKPLKHSQAYRYIHITDETWKKYESASQCVREQKNFNVASWYVRAHYARMHGKTVLVKAHYAYRRKGVVTENNAVDYIV